MQTWFFLVEVGRSGWDLPLWLLLALMMLEFLLGINHIEVIIKANWFLSMAADVLRGSAVATGSKVVVHRRKT